jgi:hypothetical protein
MYVCDSGALIIDRVKASKEAAYMIEPGVVGCWRLGTRQRARVARRMMIFEIINL